MAAVPGDKFSIGDLAPLLALANGRSSSQYNLTGFHDVSPMFQDNAGNNYGYRQLTDFAVASGGTHYVVGDVVTSPGGYVTLEVAAVNASGGIVGLIVKSNTGFAPGTSGSGWETTNDPVSPGALTGGSGSGANLTFLVAHVGPYASYSLPDYTAGIGTITSLVVNAAGTGYQVNDVLAVTVLTFPAGSFTLTVTAVNGSGGITGFTVNAGSAIGYPNSLPIPASFAALAITGGNGTGATFTALFVLPQKPAWLTELNRLRNAIYAVGGAGGAFMSPSTATAVSGPWPVAGPDPNYLYNTMYFPASGSAVDVTMTVNIPGELSGKNTYAFHSEFYNSSWENPNGVFDEIAGQTLQTASAANSAIGTVIEQKLTYSAASGTPPSDTFTYDGSLGNQACVISGSTMTLIIGGNSPVLVQGTFYMQANYFCGCTYNGTYGNLSPDFGSPVAPPPGPVLIGTSPPTPTVSGNFPGTMGIATGPRTGSWIGFGNAGGNLPYGGGFGTSNGYYWAQIIYFEVNQMLAPGRYTFTITAPTYGDDSQVNTSEAVQTVNGDGVSGWWGGSISTTNSILQPRYVLSGSFQSGGLISSFISGWPQVTGVATASKVINTGAVQTAGIHNSESVWKLPLDWDTNGLAAIAGQVDYTMQPCAPPFITPTAMEGGSDSTGGWLQCWRTPGYYPGRDQMWAWSLSGLPTPILWSAQTPPICNLNVATAAMMPWNQYRTKYASGGNATVNPALLGDLAPNVGSVAKVSNSYDPDGSHKVVEAQLEPPGWLASRYFTVGFTIMDGNGNFQQVTTAGVSGGGSPTWATKQGLPTSDGAVVWSCVKVLKSAQSIAPAQHRLPDIPRYPVYWFSETVARLEPPTSTSGLTIWGAYDQWILNVWARNSFGQITGYDPGWQSKFPAVTGPPAVAADAGGMAFGWFIYSVSINRVTYPVKTRGPVTSSEFGMGDTGAPGMGDEGQSGTGVGGPGTGSNVGPIVDNSEISCTIGCMRNGSFVAFQTFQTGATYQVLWPVFTSNALVYQCSERLDIQALAIASGGAGVSLGATLMTPALVAAYIEDTVALLNLIT